MKLFSIALALNVIFALFFVKQSSADTIPVNQSICTVIDYSSSGPNNKPDLLFDDDDAKATAWSSYDVDQLWKLLPAYVVVDLGEEKDINGLSCRTHKNIYTSHIRKPSYTEVYVSNDTANWGDPQLNSMFQWTLFDADDKQSERKEMFFGAKKGRYVKVVFKKTYLTTFTFEEYFATDRKRIWLRDMFFYENTAGASTKINPIVEIKNPGIKESVNDPFDVECSVNTDQEIHTSIVSGPATMVSGTNTVTFTGDGGFVVVECKVNENETYNSASNYIVIPVLDINSFHPAIKSSLARNYPIQMSELSAFPISFYVDSLPEYVPVESASITVNGEELELVEVNGGYQTIWTPDSYGNHVVTITANASNGNVDTENYLISVTKDAVDVSIKAMDKVHVSFPNPGQTVEVSASLPQFVGAYNKIIGNLSISCPASTGCDPWDRVSRLWVKGNNSNWIEIIRYMTPYGVACDHTIDLTDYMSILQGEVKFRVYIETWEKGWDVSLDLDYVAGEPEFLYTKVTEVWNGKYQFGNYTNLQPVPEKKVAIDTNVAQAKLSLVTTGHGWGDLNTYNAAEFYHAQHIIEVNSSSFDQDLWMDCNPNPDGCTGQMGTWQHDRAGWCPGAIAAKYTYDLNNEFAANDELIDTLAFNYLFQESYVDLCHPNHPDCVTGVTCTDCNDTYNPSYFVAGNLITYLKNSQIDSTGTFNAEFPIKDLAFSVYPSISNGEVKINCEFDFNEATVELIAINGNTLKMYLFYEASDLNNQTFDFSNLNSGVYFIRLTTNEGFGVQKLIIN